MKFLCEQCKAKYQIADEKVAGKTVRMKCRKCGHQIEVRAAVTETSVSGIESKQDELDRTMADPASPQAPSAPRPAARPGVAPMATSFASARAPRPTSGGPASKGPDSSLASAFQRNVHEEGTSPGLREMSQNDEWYVAINGVPVGPIRIGEVRRKAAVGAVTEDSLVWQEGLDEWRQVKTFAELAEVVREAATSGRTSLISAPPPPPMHATPPPAPTRPAAPAPAGASPASPARPQPPRAAPTYGQRPAAPDRGAPLAPRAPSPQTASPAMASAMASPSARSNVVQIGSRLATAERLDDAPMPLVAPPSPAPPAAAPGAFASAGAMPGAAAMAAGLGAATLSPAPVPVLAAADPFAAPPPAATSDIFGPQIPGWSAERAGAVAAVAAPAPIVIETPARKSPPWLIIAMLVLAAAFGITAALAVFLRPAQPVSPVVIQMSGTPNGAPAPTGTGTAATPDNNTNDTPSPTSTGKATGPLALGTAPKGTAPAPTTSSTGGALDLGGLGEGRTQLSDDPNPANAPRPAGQCLSESQVMSVINVHQAGVRRVCWEQSPSTKTSVNISVGLTIGGGGNVEAVSAGGDDNSVASCVAAQVRRWSFPALGCSQKTAFGYHFIR